MPYWSCYFHIVWATKYRQSIITPQMETFIFAAINQKSSELHSPVLALNGVTDHLHVAICIAPSVSVSNWVGQVKGLAAHSVNAVFGNLETPFKWQEGYGVVTFGEKQLPFVQAYIANQKQHHSVGGLVEKLERFDE